MNDVPTGSADSEVMAPLAPSSSPAPSSSAPSSSALLAAASASDVANRAPAVSEAPTGPAEPAASESSVAAPRAQTLGATSNEAMPTIAGIGVLLVNLGTPDAPEPKAVRRYLKEFLSDRRVIEKDTLLWKFVLNGIILPLRSRRKARDYEKIWNREKNESPLKTITRSQAEKLAGILEPLGKHVIVDWFAARSAGRARLRPHSRHAALSAICRAHHRDGRRRSVPLFAAAAPAAGDTDHAGLLRRSLLHRSAVVLAQG